MILLDIGVGWLSTPCSQDSIQIRVKEEYAFLLFLQAVVLGVFMVLNVFLPCGFWETMLVSMHVLVV